MKPFHFEASDFDDDAGGYGPYAERLAAIANRKLAEWLEQEPMVYGERVGTSAEWVWRERDEDSYQSHTALLVCIQPLKEGE
jgi:hypothetical protein